MIQYTSNIVYNSVGAGNSSAARSRGRTDLLHDTDNAAWDSRRSNTDRDRGSDGFGFPRYGGKYFLPAIRIDRAGRWSGYARYKNIADKSYEYS